MSTLSEIAANLLKRERVTEDFGVDLMAQDALGWDQLMTPTADGEAPGWPVAFERPVAERPARGRVTVLRVIEGGLS